MPPTRFPMIRLPERTRPGRIQWWTLDGRAKVVGKGPISLTCPKCKRVLLRGFNDDERPFTYHVVIAVECYKCGAKCIVPSRIPEAQKSVR